VKVTFIQPNMSASRSGDAMQPLSFAILSGLTPPSVDRVLFDERLERIRFEEPTDLVALSVNTFSAKRAYAIADAFHARGIPVVMGGFHPTFMPEEAHGHADSLVIGDAEDTWPSLLEDFMNGALKSEYRGDMNRPLDGLFFDRSIFRKKRYLGMTPVQFGRGCRFACDFCCIRSFYGPTRRSRPAGEVAAEIAGLASKNVFFVDDNMLLDRERLIDLLSRLAPLGRRWACQISMDAAGDAGLLRLMRRSGCMAVYIGLESLDSANVAQMGKAPNRGVEYAGAVRRFKDHGIMVCGSFVFGYDGDTVRSVERSVRFARRAGLCLSHFNILFPTPGTPIYERLRRENRLPYGEWWMSDAFRYDACYMEPLGMTAGELESAIYRARRSFNSAPSIVGRALDRKANARTPFNLLVYLAANLINRREVGRKRGLRLG